MKCVLKFTYKNKEPSTFISTFQEVNALEFELKALVKKIKSEEHEAFTLTIHPTLEQDLLENIFVCSSREKDFVTKTFSNLKVLEDYIKSIEPNETLSEAEIKNSEESNSSNNLTQKTTEELMVDELRMEETKSHVEELEKIKIAFSNSTGDERNKLCNRVIALAYSIHPGYEDLGPTRMINIQELLNVVISALYFSNDFYHRFRTESTKPESNIVIMPGRSVFLHTILLPKLGIKSFSFAFSGSPYLKSKVNKNQVVRYRDHLKKAGLTPAVLDQAEHIHFLDCIQTGSGVHSLIIFFSHWKYDIEHNTVSEPVEWCKLYRQDPNYQAYIKKTELHTTVKLYEDGRAPDLTQLPLKLISNLSSNVGSKLDKNFFHCHIPMFPSILWDYPEDVIDAIFKGSTKEALYHCDMALKMLAVVQNIVNIANMIYEKYCNGDPSFGFQLFFYNLKFGSTYYDTFIYFSENITYEQFLSEYIPLFITKLVVLYPILLVSMDQIGPEKAYKNVIEFMLNTRHNLQPTSKIICELRSDIESIRKYLSDHPWADRICQAIKALYEGLNIQQNQKTRIPSVSKIQASEVPASDPSSTAKLLLIQFNDARTECYFRRRFKP